MNINGRNATHNNETQRKKMNKNDKTTEAAEAMGRAVLQSSEHYKDI